MPLAEQHDDLLFAPAVPKIHQPKIEVERISEAQRAAAARSVLRDGNPYDHQVIQGCQSRPQGTSRILMPIGIVIIAIVAIAGGTISQILKVWLNRPGRAVPPQADLREIRDGLGQLQQAVDAIAVEVERLSEGQRFTTKLLSDQAREVAPSPPVVRER